LLARPPCAAPRERPRRHCTKPLPCLPVRSSASPGRSRGPISPGAARANLQVKPIFYIPAAAAMLW
jgi:hypothetical protein